MIPKLKKYSIYDNKKWIVTYKGFQISFDNFIDAFIYWIKHLLKELI